MGLKFDWNDIAIVPAAISEISSRSEINARLSNGKLPLFAAPMDMVIDSKTAKLYSDVGITVCLPRGVKPEVEDDTHFYSYGLDEIIDIVKNNGNLPNNVLIDVANGNMRKLLDISKEIKDKYKISLMIGNVANPETYREICKIGVDYTRINVGSGSSCITACNTAIFYPSASLVSECYEISKEFSNPTKIISDGGFRNFSDIIKAVALGAHGVMIGGILSKSIESSSDCFKMHQNGYYSKVSMSEAIDMFNNDNVVYKHYRGMSTKAVQKDWGKSNLKTSEGIAFYNKVEYSIYKWIENFEDYLKSSMSYTNSKDLDSFSGKVQYVNITQNSFNRFNK